MDVFILETLMDASREEINLSFLSGIDHLFRRVQCIGTHIRGQDVRKCKDV